MRGQTEGQTEGRTDSILQDPFSYCQGSNKTSTSKTSNAFFIRTRKIGFTMGVRIFSGYFAIISNLRVTRLRIEILQKIKYQFHKHRSSNWRCSIKNGVLKNFAKFTGNHLCRILFCNKDFQKKRLLHRCFL